MSIMPAYARRVRSLNPEYLHGFEEGYYSQRPNAPGLFTPYAYLQGYADGSTQRVCWKAPLSTTISLPTCSIGRWPTCTSTSP